MRSRTLGAVCATCAVAMPVSARAQAHAPATSARPAPPVLPVLPTPGQHIGPGRPPVDVFSAHKLALIKRRLMLQARRRSLLGERLGRRERDRLGAELRMLTPQRLRAGTRALRDDVRDLRGRVLRERKAGAPDRPVPAALRAIARCESGGDPRAISAGGTYRGKYQFDHATWASVGGDGDPSSASESEQDRRAALLYRRSGTTPWPVCGS